MALTHGIHPKWVGDVAEPNVSLYPHWVELIEITEPQPRGGKGPVLPLDEVAAARRAREDKEIIEVAVALITSGVLDELI